MVEVSPGPRAEGSMTVVALLRDIQSAVYELCRDHVVIRLTDQFLSESLSHADCRLCECLWLLSSCLAVHCHADHSHVWVNVVCSSS